jgi:hypothetical protein
MNLEQFKAHVLAQREASKVKALSALSPIIKEKKEGK